MDQSFYYHTHLTDFIALDLETTGLSASKNQIIEVAAVQFYFGEVRDVFHSMIDPNLPIPPEITRITGISNADIKGAPSIQKILPLLMNFIGDRPIVGHNIDFDAGFLEVALKFQHNDFLAQWKDGSSDYRYFTNPRYDSGILSRMLFPYFSSYRLTALSKHFNIAQEHAHRALDDSKACGFLFLLMAEEMAHRSMAALQQVTHLLSDSTHPMKAFFEGVLKAKKEGHFDESRELIHKPENHYNVIGKNIDNTSEDSLELIHDSEVSDFFSSESKLAKRLENFEQREEQVALVQEIKNAFNKSHFLVSEAGTGTGKSLAYLLPAILWSIKNRNKNGRVVISTHTKNLQEQLFYKDIPFLKGLIDSEFTAALLKGKNNYICKDKYIKNLDYDKQNLTDYEKNLALYLIYWLETTNTGDIAENNAYNIERNAVYFNKFVAENNYCPGKKCKYYSDCHLINIRTAAKQSNIVVINHSLLFSVLNADTNFFGEFSHLVLDEAHNIEKVATEYLGTEINLWLFRRIINAIFQHDKHEKGFIVSLIQRLTDNNSKVPEEITNRLKLVVEELKFGSIKFSETVEQFFRQALIYLRKNSSGKENEKTRYAGNTFLAPLSEYIHDLDNVMMDLIKSLSACEEILCKIPDDSFYMQLQTTQESKSLFTDIVRLQTSFSDLMNGGMANFVYWFELPRKLESTDIHFYSAPIEINNLLNHLLYQRLSSAIFTSATLQVNRKFDFFKKRIGLNFVDQNVEEFAAGSPFNYEKQVKVKLTSFLPDPSSLNFNLLFADFLRKFIPLRPNGILVLFTSYTQLDQTYLSLKTDFDRSGRKLIAQGKDGSRQSLVDSLKKEKGVILFGTDSFWEGIDVPGSSLETVIICKLPFAVPSEPVIAAKMDKIKEDGGNPFMEYSLPEAIIKLRQGFGRLIRSRSDQGEVILCDSRIFTKFYGKTVIHSLPVVTQVFRNEIDFFNDYN